MFANVDEVQFMLSRARLSLFRWDRGMHREVPDIPVQRRGDDEDPRVSTTRVWMLSEPATTCQRDRLREMWRYLSAGQQLWALDEERALDLGLPDQDFWIIDDECVLSLHYSRQYVLTGGEVTVGAEVDQYRTWRDRALSKAVSPLTEAHAL